jgi:cell division protein FtsA
MQELAEYILKKPVKIGYPRSFGGMTNIMQNPKFSTVLGLLLEGAKHGHEQIINKNNEEQSRLVSQGDLISKLSESLKSVFKEIF